MLYYNRLDVSEGTGPTKSSNSKKSMICNYWFLNHGFKFQDLVSNGFHNLRIFCLNISGIVIITVKNVVYRCIIHSIIHNISLFKGHFLTFLVLLCIKRMIVNAVWTSLNL